jgi:integrating conjugative element protein (TIGR03757 family)
MLAFSRALLGLVLVGPLLLIGNVRAAAPLSVEAFTTTEFLISGNGDQQLHGAKLAVYFLDGLGQIERALSQNLPIQAEAAKAEALRRVQQLDDTRMAPAKNAAVGLAKAVQYGVDRYPAIVFDEWAVVYGVTDLVEALDLYEAWQREQTR